MKIRIRDGRMSVGHHHGDHRSVVIHCAGLEFALTPSEAITLADRLVDAVERPASHTQVGTSHTQLDAAVGQ